MNNELHVYIDFITVLKAHTVTGRFQCFNRSFIRSFIHSW